MLSTGILTPLQMTTLNDDDLVAYADRVKGKIVVITGTIRFSLLYPSF